MPIETTCPGCSRRLRVADEHAGKTARCPACQTLYTVPAGAARPSQGAAAPAASEPASAYSEPQPTASPSFPSSTASAATSAPPRWRLKTEDGSIYGPVDRYELDNWVAQGRVTPNAEVQQDGDAFWQRAANVYPELAITRPSASGGNPFSDQSTAFPANPYVIQGGTQARRYRESNRGGLVLALGLISLFGCSLLGPVALVMGMVDLQKMSNGTMDPSGRGLTIAGMVIAGITVFIMAIAILAAIAGEM